MSEFTGHIQSLSNIGFGDMVKIEMYRYGVKNELYIHKVVGSLNSNSWTETPLKYNSEEKLHDHMEEVLNVIQCGIDETKVIRVAAKDVTKIEKQPKTNKVQELNENQEIVLEWLKNQYLTHYRKAPLVLLAKFGWSVVGYEMPIEIQHAYRLLGSSESLEILQAFATWALDQC